MSRGIKAERLFAELCNRQFLRGFVFHSPRFDDPDMGEKEVGDIVLWVRRQIIVVEVIAREAPMGSSTKQFVKRIGNKRDQLARDYSAFKNPEVDINLINEYGEEVPLGTDDISGFGFAGIVIVDCDDHLENLHFQTVEKSLEFSFPVAIMTRKDFLDLTLEIDTIPDLMYYLHDRSAFVKQIFGSQTHLFLDLNRSLERNLIAFYKMHENRFSLDHWEPNKAFSYHAIYTNLMREEIDSRNAENDKSYVIDNILDYLRRNNQENDSTLIHSWELAATTRRQRALGLAGKVQNAIDRMLAGNNQRHFAFFNQATGCWSVFYFQYGGDRESFVERAERLTRYKLFVEMKERNFEYSVFGYAFRKSSLETGSTFDDIFLIVEDASNYRKVPESEYRSGRKYFGSLSSKHIQEFPSQ